MKEAPQLCIHATLVQKPGCADHDSGRDTELLNRRARQLHCRPACRYVPQHGKVSGGDVGKPARGAP